MSLPPLRRQVLVACDQATAYRVFLGEIGAWWPLDTHGCFGAGGNLALTDGRIVETGPAGDVAVWGTVLAEDEPRTVTFSWHPGRDADAATRVTVAFTPTGNPDATLVTLEHTGWEAYGDPEAARDEYAGGWVTVLGSFTDVLTAADDSADLWFVLQHTPGPAAPPAGVFASPDFPKHLRFLGELQSDGLLVAGGPLPDTPGAGMTIVRTRSVDAARLLVSAAQTQDGSVACGLLEVRVRPWRVAMTADE
ncbi:SRPBCC domain-containing protein [Micropruina sp.]|uniref:SRPBCC domain-containing protein n=1 Tax=Micropruina sp. TaxID=2737536 RepID=UPI0039E6071A